MKRFLTGGAGAALAGAALVLSLGASPALAQRGGSYMRSCSNVRAYGDRIIADCRSTDGNWQRTVLRDADRCVGDIANMNGQLTCNRGGREYGWERRSRERWDRQGDVERDRRSWGPNGYSGYGYQGGDYQYGR